MSNDNLKLKLAYVPGLRDVVFNEIKKESSFKIISEDKDAFYINYVDDFEKIKTLKTVSRAYLVDRNLKLNPVYLKTHKSALGNLINIVISKNPTGTFNTFKINCAGSDTKEITALKEYLVSEFKLMEDEEADAKIYIAKIDGVWEVGLQITPRPLSLRKYKIKNISGAMDPTIASSLNYLCKLENYKSYLNIFSGSATLMIEAGLNYENLEKIIGFDNNKERLSASIQNIKQAGLIRKLLVKELDIMDQPNLGKFDVITADLPFGMAISKGENLEALYKAFIESCEKSLNFGGRLAVYTSEFEIFEKLIKLSNFKLEKEYKVNLITNEGEYLPVKILIYKYGEM